jgi:hypothetical protein
MYRFRVLNACNGRFLHLSLSNEQKFHQIGKDQGRLPAPVLLERSLLATDERAHKSKAKSPDAGALPASLRPVPKTPESAAVKTRPLALIEKETMKSESMSMLLNNTPPASGTISDPRSPAVSSRSSTRTGGKRYAGPVTAPAPGEAGRKEALPRVGTRRQRNDPSLRGDRRSHQVSGRTPLILDTIFAKGASPCQQARPMPRLLF